MTLAWDSPAQVNWSEQVTSDQVATFGTGVTTRRFETSRSAVRSVIKELDATRTCRWGSIRNGDAPL